MFFQIFSDLVRIFQYRPHVVLVPVGVIIAAVIGVEGALPMLRFTVPAASFQVVRPAQKRARRIEEINLSVIVAVYGDVERRWLELRQANSASRRPGDLEEVPDKSAGSHQKVLQFVHGELLYRSKMALRPFTRRPANVKCHEPVDSRNRADRIWRQSCWHTEVRFDPENSANNFWRHAIGPVSRIESECVRLKESPAPLQGLRCE